MTETALGVPLTDDSAFARFVRAVDAEVKAVGTDEQAVTQAVARHLRTWFDAGVTIPEPLRRPNADHYVMYPMYVAPDGSFSIASAVWNVGQKTPVHDHGTWGVIGIVTGREKERRFLVDPSRPNGLRELDEGFLESGDIEICCTTDQDVHSVAAAGDVPCVGIHVYGADIGTLPRRSYAEADGSCRTFVSAWAQPQ
ncbi:cysteine dioxygenase family protein [Streptomyces sp. NPDC047070]|uniref:cysteine dioxygenase family protein n=1 Tax=Streptomyces sp. NPDC047070 TaxID=3154923 RepID=UPI003452E415